VSTTASASARALAAVLDHTLLRPDATAADIDRLCEEARRHGFHAVCLQPCWVARAARALAGSGVGVASVVAFPHGASVAAIKAAEAARAVADGATELDVVANLGWIRAGDDAALTADLAAVVAAAPGIPVKAILETNLFPAERKAAAARAACAAGVAFVKTSTGFGTAATEEDVALLRRVVGPSVGVKASGGIRTRAQALALLAAGASRLGTSASVTLVAEEDAARARPPG
jgi:deoxyribose-phosphate aldolase